MREKEGGGLYTAVPWIYLCMLPETGTCCGQVVHSRALNNGDR